MSRGVADFQVYVVCDCVILCTICTEAGFQKRCAPCTEHLQIFQIHMAMSKSLQQLPIVLMATSKNSRKAPIAVVVCQVFSKSSAKELATTGNIRSAMPTDCRGTGTLQRLAVPISTL